jgi:hypothetical protein
MVRGAETVKVSQQEAKMITPALKIALQCKINPPVITTSHGVFEREPGDARLALLRQSRQLAFRSKIISILCTTLYLA